MNVLKLKQIIKEEVEKALKEAPSSEFAPIESALNDFYDSYLAKDLRLSKEITPEERIERLQSFAGLLKSYISKLNSGIEEEEFWISKNQGLNESDKKVLTYKELEAKYNPEDGPAYTKGLINEPGFNALSPEKQKELLKWLEHQREMDR
jgi:hypothetical protein